MAYKTLIGHQHYVFNDLKTLMAKATPLRSGDQLAGVAAENATDVLPHKWHWRMFH